MENDETSKEAFSHAAPIPVDCDCPRISYKNDLPMRVWICTTIFTEYCRNLSFVSYHVEV